ncbi:dihydrodipicolinate synthetase [Caldicellulosiruptor hydrothermalis 108]|uniref:Dihydrodipicolinate synthetase n=1 Tax=Caldicellulosiruptor hydrothermalis (strain DSM 18901 / VKM B-2411 / 108) TaxID=632292 RepID=E4Q7Y8_CALH1|nr:dihydrodipicolinate synthase family protein [Caldicellulosiruptor hydrothermalis]ADQ07906.1 dihydrodipicolinate synthetase [Caldicellulosiruptor hydrothermalis 108]
MKDERLKGVIVPVVTPFDKEDEIDEKIFRREVRYLLQKEINGISIGGSTGEGCAISDNELARLIEIAQEENKRNLPVVAGIIRHSTRDAIKAGLLAKKAGATALMVTPISYLGGTDEKGNFEYYKRIAEETEMPIIIYNVVAQNEIRPELMEKLVNECANIIGIKQSIGGIEAMVEMINGCGKEINVYCATDELLFTGFALGADGAIASIITVFPDEVIKMWKAAKEGKIEEGKKIEIKLFPIWLKIKKTKFPRGIKAALNLLGREVGIPRSPVGNCNELEMRLVEAAMKEYRGMREEINS